jgi:hypothetical protein
MNGDNVLRNYSKELQLLDMLDWLQDVKGSLVIPSFLEVDPSNERNDEQLHQKDQIPKAFSLDN